VCCVVVREMAPLGTAAVAALVLCAGSALGKWREPAPSPLLTGSFIGGTTGPWKTVGAQWYANQSDCIAGSVEQVPIFKWLVPSIGSTCVKPATGDGARSRASDSWWSVIQMSSTAIEMDLFNTSDCAGQASRLTVKPGDCADATGINLGQFNSPYGPWVKLSAPAEMPGGFQFVQYKASDGRADTCDDTVPIDQQVGQFWNISGGATTLCRELPLLQNGINVDPEIKRSVAFGCLGYGGRAVWAEVAKCSDLSASTGHFRLLNKTCHQPLFGASHQVDPKLSPPTLTRS
jgi:hypothetical protein